MRVRGADPLEDLAAFGGVHGAGPRAAFLGGERGRAFGGGARHAFVVGEHMLACPAKKKNELLMGLFASFNMPLPCADHPCAALRAAIDIQRAVGARTFGDQRVALATRIGISTGPVIGGSIGAGQRMSYTLPGLTAVPSPRALKDLNKHHGTRILASQSTRYALRRFLRVRGAGPCAGARHAARPSRSSASIPTGPGNAP